jgi:lipopolysaccharide transport system permease protein
LLYREGFSAMETNPEPTSSPSVADAWDAADHARITLIEPTPPSLLSFWQDLWEHRELLYFLTWRDVKVRYKQTVLGALWAVIQPLWLMIVFTLFLSPAPTGEPLPLPYALYVFTGLVMWNLFATALAGAAMSLTQSERLITKVFFPRLLLPTAALGPALVDFVVSCVVLAGLAAWHRALPAASAPLILLPLVVVTLAVIGAGALLSALNVTYRDFRYTTTFLLQAWMFATPAIYLASFASPLRENGLLTHPLARLLIVANPLNGAIAFFRAALFGLPLPWALLGSAALVALAMFVVGLAFFRKTERRFADVI